MSDYIAKDEVSGEIKDAGSLRYLLRFTHENRYQFLLAVVMLILSSILSIATARLIGELVEVGLGEKNATLAWTYAGLTFLFELIAIILVWQGRKVLARAATHSLLLIRKQLFKHIHELPIGYYDREPLGRTITRMTHDVEGIEDFFTGSVARTATGLFTFVIAIVAMWMTNLKFGIILSLAMIPSLFVLFSSRRLNRDLNRTASQASSACNSKLSEFINSLPVIRVFGLENWSLDRYSDIVEDYRKSLYATNKFFSWSRPFILFLCELPLILLFYFGGLSILDGDLTIGVFVAFMGYCRRFSNPLMTLSREISVIQQAFTSAERVTTFLQAQTEDELFGKSEGIKLDSFNGQITFNNVHMSYDGEKAVLKGVNFKIAAGEKIGLVGRTGSGKTTTVSLLSRLYDYQQGEIHIDDHEIKSLSRDYLREHIGFVSQDVIIFKGTLRENLLCESEIDENQLINACELTGLTKVMNKNNMNLESEILDQGANLSAGEKQLISLTRVLLKNPRILVLDEATASIDPYYEELIHEAVDKIMKQRTCLMIAHRLDTLKSCDRIFVFKDGELVEHGSHTQLIEKRGLFNDLLKNSQQISDA